MTEFIYTMHNVRKAVGDLPVVAIGGITVENLQSDLKAGATCAAVISAALADPARIANTTERLISLAC